MTQELIIMFIKIVIFLPITLGLIYVIVKYGNGKLQNFSNGKVISITERVSFSKNSSFIVVKVLDDYYLVSVNNDKSEILTKLDNNKVEELKKENNNINIKNFTDKLISKKDDMNE